VQEEENNCIGDLAIKPESKKPLENTSLRWKDNIKMGINEIRSEVMDRWLRKETSGKLLGSI